MANKQNGQYSFDNYRRSNMNLKTVANFGILIGLFYLLSLANGEEISARSLIDYGISFLETTSRSFEVQRAISDVDILKVSVLIPNNFVLKPWYIFSESFHQTFGICRMVCRWDRVCRAVTASRFIMTKMRIKENQFNQLFAYFYLINGSLMHFTRFSLAPRSFFSTSQIDSSFALIRQ